MNVVDICFFKVYKNVKIEGETEKKCLEIKKKSSSNQLAQKSKQLRRIKFRTLEFSPVQVDY